MTRIKENYQGKFFLATYDMYTQEENFKRKLSHVCTGPLKLYSRTKENIELVKKNLQEKTCSLYTQGSKATKELVKENFVMCVGLNNLIQLVHLKTTKIYI